MGISYEVWKTLCGSNTELRSLHPAASSRSDDQIIRELAGERAPPPHKYHAQATEYNGRKYPSKAQAARAYQLDMLAKNKAIHGYLEEVTFRLGPDFRYRADFVVFGDWVACNSFEVWAEDVKGYMTPRFKTAVKLWRKYGPFPLHVIGNKSTEVIGGSG